jgi:hypothetical protein
MMKTVRHQLDYCVCVPHLSPFSVTAALFEMEEKDLMQDLKDLPRNRLEYLSPLSF